jgi:hypothetical protein
MKSSFYLFIIFILGACATLPDNPKIAVNPSYTGSVLLANASGKRADQIARALESEFLKAFPSATLTSSSARPTQYAIDFQVNDGVLKQTSANREEKNCARYSDPDPKAQGFIAQALSRKCLSWETKIIPCTLNSYELDIQLRIGDSQKRSLVSDRKVFQQSERVCQGSTGSTTALIVKTEQEAGQWVVGNLSKTINTQSVAIAQSPSLQTPSKKPEPISLSTANTALTTRCEPQQIIKFADGSQDCMSSYGFFNQTFDNKKAVMISFANERGKIAIAFSKDFKACPLSIINWSESSAKALENCNRRIAQQAKDEKINPDSCQCEALIEDGVTKFSKQEFARKIDEYIATRSARLLATNIGPNASQSIPMNAASAPVLTTGSLSEKEKVNKVSAQTAKSVYALVIGNGQYKKAGLLNPVNDANEIAKRFIQYGFTVKVILDGDRKTLIKALGDFQAQSVNYETNILFYAGHGIQYNGINYIIPTDMSLEAGSASIDFDAISTNQIVDKYMRGKTKLVFLDACRDNPLARSFIASRGLGSVSKGLAPMDVASGTLISYATKDGNVAVDGDGKNSPYTEALLKHLDSREDISLILRKVRQDVMNKTKGQQVPWDYGSLVGGQLILSNK